MKAKPIGTRMAPARDTGRRKPLHPGPTPASGPADIYPVTVRINAGPARGKVFTFSRLVITDDAVYLATSPDKGRTIDAVTRYARPSGNRTTSGAKKGSWGPFSWSGCGCVNQWGNHSRSKLLALADSGTAKA